MRDQAATAAKMELSFVLRVEHEYKPNAGEDALCCNLRTTDGRDVCLVACLDGCGGSGAARYPTAENWSGARYGAHLVGGALYRWFERGDSSASLKPILDEELQAAHHKLTAGGAAATSAGLKSRMIRPLPTTLSAVLCEPERTGLKLTYFWVGDSRGYLFTPDGLVQVTRDDIEGVGSNDLTDDGALSNVLSATGDYHINADTRREQSPCIAIVATDGCFNYFVSPMLFEGMLLDTLAQAKSPNDWENGIRRALLPIAGDDFSLSMAAYGFRSFPEVQSCYRRRHEMFEATYGAAIRRMQESRDAEGLQALLRKYMEHYFSGKG